MNLFILLFCSFASSSTEQLTGKAVWTWKLDSRVILWFLFVLLSLYLFFHQLWKFIFLTTPFFILEQKQNAVITSHSSCAKIASHTSSVFTMQEYRKRQQQQREVLRPIRHTHTHTNKCSWKYFCLLYLPFNPSNWKFSLCSQFVELSTAERDPSCSTSSNQKRYILINSKLDYLQFSKLKV